MSRRPGEESGPGDEYPDGPKWQRAPNVFNEPGSASSGPWPRDAGPATPPELPRPETPPERHERRMPKAVVAVCAVALAIVIIVVIVIR